MPTPLLLRTRFLTALRLGAVLVAGVPTLAVAQQSTTRGLSLGVQAVGTSLTVENGDQNGGGGLGLRVGYGFNRIVTGYVAIDGSQVDIPDGSTILGKWSMAHAEVGARFHFANSLRRWVPYLETAVGGRSVSVNDATVNSQPAGKVTFSGGAFTVGGGLSAYFTRKVAFDASLRWTSGQFTKVDLGSVSLNNLDIDAKSFRLGIGLVWWPKA